MNEKIAVLGLGYVGLPVAHALGQQFDGVVGFDINKDRIAALRAGRDATGELSAEDLAATRLLYSHDADELKSCTFFIVTVPTPIDANRQPDLGPVRSACRTIGRAMRPGAVVVFESTVYPGVTELVCGPLLAEVSGLKQGSDFKLGYSPERINPGDREHTLARIVKVVSGEDGATLERVAAVYGRIVPAGLHRAPSIMVAEAAKVIENTQRDINIALMNELALIFDRMGLRTRDVLEAASTKWNFLRFHPGLVGGHCIGVDPYYLTTRAQELGYHPEVILAGRRINDDMGKYLAQKTVKLLAQAGHPIGGARVGILGLTFKENVPDLRNSRVPDIWAEFRQFNIDAVIHDPMADPHEAMEEYGVRLASLDAFRALDALVVAVAHRPFEALLKSRLSEMLVPGGVLVDVKSMLSPAAMPPGVTYWSL
jgi:UDP-N-acetyl-D-galactosamine dehydrogenase